MPTGINGADNIETDLDNATDGLSALKTEIDANETKIDDLDGDVVAAKAVIDDIHDTDLPLVKTDTGNIVTRLGTPAAGTVAGDVESIETKVDTAITDIAANQTDLNSILADVGDASGATLGSIFGILGNPAATITADIGTNQDYLDGTTATPAAYRREHGRTQVFEKSITVAANAGVTIVASITSQPCLIESIVIHADAAQTGDMTTCAVYGGAANAVEFIGVGDATQANLDAADKQVAWVGRVRLVPAKSIIIDLQGTGATALDLTVTTTYFAAVDGGYLT